MSSSPEVARSGSDSLVQDTGVVVDNARPANAAEASLRPKVLVADDDAIGRTLLTSLLTKWGYEVIAAPDGDQALKVLQSQNGVQLAVLDWMMDRTNGIEVCQRIRAIADL